jgi:hypothetical protein
LGRRQTLIILPLGGKIQYRKKPPALSMVLRAFWQLISDRRHYKQLHPSTFWSKKKG